MMKFITPSLKWLKKAVRDEKLLDDHAGPLAMNPNLIPCPQPLETLKPKFNCPTCGDWFQLPYKDCKCNSDTKKDWEKVTERK